jgi:hypothetical protein
VYSREPKSVQTTTSAELNFPFFLLAEGLCGADNHIEAPESIKIDGYLKGSVRVTIIDAASDEKIYPIRLYLYKKYE